MCTCSIPGTAMGSLMLIITFTYNLHKCHVYVCYCAEGLHFSAFVAKWYTLLFLRLPMHTMCSIIIMVYGVSTFAGYRFTLAELEAKIDELEGKFDELRTNTLHALQGKRVIVSDVVYQLTTLKAREISEHKVFLKENLKMLKKHDDLVELFEDLNFYWNYLSPGLLEHLAKKFCLSSITMEIKSYKGALNNFRAKMSLKLFCLIEVKYIAPTEEFCNLVVNFKVHLSRDTTLQDVEDFRRRYASHYSLYDFTLRLNSILPGSFIVSFLVPQSIVEILRVNIPEEMLKAFCVTQLEIAGSCVYSDSESDVCPRPRSMSAPVISHSTLASAKDRKLALTQQQLREVLWYYGHVRVM